MFCLKVFLLLVTALKAAYRVDSTLTPRWVNQYDGKMDWYIGGNNMVTGFFSVHNNYREDRIWKFYYGRASGNVACSFTGRLGDDYMNAWDGTLSFVCPPNSAINAFKSVHSNQKEDRRWNIGCCKVSGAFLVEDGITGFLNPFDGKLQFKCGSSQVLVGVGSVHNNYYEDRRWTAQCAYLVPRDSILLSSEMSDWQNSMDGALESVGEFSDVITGLYSVHSNVNEDRRWKFAFGNTNRVGRSEIKSGLICRAQEWTTWMNDFDGALNFNCPTNHLLDGVSSYHHNWREDRRWKFKCCSANGFTVQQLEWTGYLNSWDGILNYRCPGTDEAIIGLSSDNNNYYEDRRWKVCCGKLIRNKRT